MQPIRIHECRSREELAGFVGRWDALAAAEGCFPALAAGWMAEFLARLPQGRWTCLFALEGEVLTGVLPLEALGKKRALGFLCQVFQTPRNPFHTVRVEPLLRSGHRSPVAEMLAHLERVYRHPPFLIIKGCPESSRLLLREDGGRVALFPRPGGAENVIFLGGSLPEYRRRLSGKFLRELRRRQRKLEEMGGVRFLLRESERPTEENLGRFIAVEHSGWKGEGKTSIRSDPAEEKFYAAATRGLDRNGMLEWNFLEVGGRPIAAQLCMRAGGALYVVKVAYREDFAKFSPGNLLLWKVVENCFACGDVSQINFLTECDWHLDWAPSPQGLRDVVLLRGGSLLAFCYGAASGIRQRIKTVFRKTLQPRPKN